jgi:hypothetical protein
MTLSVVYDDNSEQLVNQLKEEISNYPLLELKTLHEGLLKERKKAFKLKGAYSARKTPFALLYDDLNKKPVIALYSESNDCNFNNIIKVLNNYIPYGTLEQKTPSV